MCQTIKACEDSLLQLQPRIMSIVCQRINTRDIYLLSQTSMLIIHPVEHLISQRNAKDDSALKNFSMLHVPRKLLRN